VINLERRMLDRAVSTLRYLTSGCSNRVWHFLPQTRVSRPASGPHPSGAFLLPDGWGSLAAGQVTPQWISKTSMAMSAATMTKPAPRIVVKTT
jgi:hypothetical protein